MSYYTAVRQAGMCAKGECEENDYIYDAPHLAPGAPWMPRETSFYAIEHEVRARKGACAVRPTPDVWEDRLLPIAA